MEKRTFKIISISYIVIVVTLFAIYLGIHMDENWVVDLDGKKGDIWTFVIFLFIGFILASINFSSLNEKSNKITKSTIYGGFSVAVFFLVWRLAVVLS